MGRIERTPQPTHLGEYFKQANNLPRFTREQNDFLFRSLKEEKSLDDIRHHPDFIKTIPMDTQEEDKYRNAFLQAKDYEHQSKDIPVKKLIALGNLGLVVSAAKELGVLSFSERLQSGNEGLVKAINSFDPDYADHISFSDYAAISIKNTIKKATYKNRLVTIPEEVEYAVSEAWKVAGSHMDRTDRPPTRKKWKQELNKQTDLDESQIERAMYVIFSGISKPASLNSTVTTKRTSYGREEELGDIIPDVAANMEEQAVSNVYKTQVAKALKDAVQALPEDQKYVVTNYYEKEQPFEEIGKALGTSRQMATKKKNWALNRLRKNEKLLSTFLDKDN